MTNVYFDRTSDLQDVRQCYVDHGIVIIRGLVDRIRLESLRETTLKVIYARARSAGITLPDGLDMDQAFNRMCAVDRKLGGNIYDCLRMHPDAIKFLADQAMVRYLELLLGTTNIYYAVDQIHFRIDRKGEERFSLPWHQDYWWNNTSKTAVTAWYSMVDVPSVMGPMRVIPGTHHVVAKINVNPLFKVRWDQNSLFSLANPPEQDAGIALPVQAGDVVFMNALVLHRSGVNESADRNRWSIVMRYADMFDPDFVKKGWKSGIRVGYLSILDTDPECVINRDQIVEPA